MQQIIGLMGYGAKAQTPLLQFVVDLLYNKFVVQQIRNKLKVAQQISNILSCQDVVDLLSTTS